MPPNVTKSIIRPEIRVSFRPSVSAGVARTGTRSTPPKSCDGDSATWVGGGPTASSGGLSRSEGWISTRSESNSCSATSWSMSSGSSTSDASVAARPGGPVDRSRTSSRSASTRSPEPDSFREKPQAPQFSRSSGFNAPQTGQGTPGSSDTGDPVARRARIQ